MSSAMYALTMLLLQTQLDVDKKFSRVKTVWLFCCCHLCEALTKANVGAEAAGSHSRLYKLLLLARERIPVLKGISDAALSALK